MNMSLSNGSSQGDMVKSTGVYIYLYFLALNVINKEYCAIKKIDISNLQNDDIYNMKKHCENYYNYCLNYNPKLNYTDLETFINEVSAVADKKNINGIVQFSYIRTI